MKTKARYIFLGLTLLLSVASFAQVDRSIGPNQYRRTTAKNKGPKADFVDQTLKYYTKELTLDDFQRAAMKTILEEQREPINELMVNRDMTTDEKRDKGKAINDIIDNKVMPILSDAQKLKYKELQDKRKY